MDKREIEEIRYAYRDCRPWLLVAPGFGVTDWRTREDAREWARLCRKNDGVFEHTRIVRL